MSRIDPKKHQHLYNKVHAHTKTLPANTGQNENYKITLQWNLLRMNKVNMELPIPSFTFKSIRHIYLELNIAKQHRQWHGEIGVSPQRNMPIACLQAIQWQYALTKEFSIFLINTKSQNSQVWKHNLTAVHMSISLTTQINWCNKFIVILKVVKFFMRDA